MHPRERRREGRRVDAEVRGERRGGGRRVGRQALVAKLERPLVRGRTGCGRVAPPRPRRACRVARRLELRPALGLDPEARPRAVGEVGVVAAAAAGAQPAALEQRADDVAAVAHDVDGAGLRVGAEGRGEDERRLGRLLDPAPAAHEREQADALEDAADARRGLGRLQRRQGGDARLQGRHLAQVDETRHAADRSGEEGRSRAGRPDDEDEAVVGRAQTRTEITQAGLAQDPPGRGAVARARRRSRPGRRRAGPRRPPPSGPPRRERPTAGERQADLLEDRLEQAERREDVLAGERDLVRFVPPSTRQA